MRKYIFTFFLVSFFYTSVYSQKWLAMMEDPEVNFYEVQKEFYNYYQSKSINSNDEPRMDGPYNRFKKWEAMMEPRVFPTGIRPQPQKMYQEWLKLKNQENSNRASANWSFIGPSSLPSNGGGAGKVNCISIDPNNTQHIWIGSSGGGLWQTTNGGASWSTNTDQQLPSLTIFDIALTPNNTNIMYIAVKEGIFKSTDAGVTWFNTGINRTCFRIQIDPNNPDIIIASSNEGLIRSSDALNTWSFVTSTTGVVNAARDIEFNPVNSNIVYASGIQVITRSADNGITWDTIAGIPSTAFGIKLAVTPANPNYVYALISSPYSPTNGGFLALLKSTNSGLTWTTMSSSPNILGYDITGFQIGGQGPYCLSLAVSPTNANEVYAGGINLWKSINAGATWTNVSDWTAVGQTNNVHADQQDLKFVPGNGNTLYAGHDGGISKTTDGGSTWTDISSGLQIMEIHKHNSSRTNASLIVAGSQDNGSNKNINGVTSRINYGDGLKCYIDYTNENTIYTSYQNGAIFRSDDGGTTQVSIQPSSSYNFMTNFTLNPLNSHTIYAVYNDVYKSTNKGSNWALISSGGLFQIQGGSVNIPIVAAPSDTNVIYIAKTTGLYRTSNGGTSWQNISPGIISSYMITGIAVSNTNANTIFVSVAGYLSFVDSSAQKVLKSTDGGLTWSNITFTGLPHVPTNCIVYQNNSPDGIYVGTDFGVYYSDNTMSSWIPYTTGLPNVRVTDLDIQYAADKLRAGTYGRGLWETDLNVPLVLNNDGGVLEIINPIGDICTGSVNPTVKLKNFGANTLTSATIKYSIDNGNIITFNWTGNLSQFATTNINLPVNSVNPGTHLIKCYAQMPNANQDLNPSNDTAYSVFAFPIANNLPYFQGFEDAAFPPVNCKVNNPDLGVTWERTTSSACTGQASMRIQDFVYYNDGMKDDFILPYLNLMNNMPYLTFKYAYQLRYDPSPTIYYSDTLAVFASTDCGQNWSLLFKKFDLDLVTTTPTFDFNVPFVPSDSSDWTTELINLSAFSGNDKVLIKFQNINGRGNNLYLDDINILATPVGIETSNFTQAVLSPNPNEGYFNLNLVSSSTNCYLKIYNLLGDLIYSHSLNNGQNRINFSNHSSGLYFYQIEKNNNTIQKGKLLIK